ncbi:Cdc7p-Dbf4p kinase complex regulatory subunit [Mactra antiquata]
MTNPKYRISPKGKRKLDYPQKKSRSNVKLPLIGKTIYLDVKENKHVKQLQHDLKRLGATLEDFVSRDINYLITAQPRPKNNEKKCHGDESPAASPFNCEPSPSPLNVDDKKVTSVTRGKALAEKARTTSRKTNTLLDNAEQWGVKIVSLEGAFKWIDKELKKLPKLSGNQSKIPTQPVCVSTYKSLKSPFVKIEAESYCYRPVHLEIEVWPRLNVDTPRGSCPFDGTLIKCGDESHEERGDLLAAQVDIPSDDTIQKNIDDDGNSTVNSGKPTTEKSCKKSDSDVLAGNRILTAGELKRRKELKRKQERKRGYCECCHIKYEDLDKHVKEEQHILYVKNKTNYEKLDTLICTGPNTQHFLSECMRKTALISASKTFKSTTPKSKLSVSPRKSPRKSTPRHIESMNVSPKKNQTKNDSKTDTKSLDNKDPNKSTRKKTDTKSLDYDDLNESTRKNVFKSPKKEKKVDLKVQENTQIKNSPSAESASKVSEEKVSEELSLKTSNNGRKIDKTNECSKVLSSPDKIKDRKNQNELTLSPKNIIESGKRSLRTSNRQSEVLDTALTVKKKVNDNFGAAKDDNKENIDPKKKVEIDNITIINIQPEVNLTRMKQFDESKTSAKKCAPSNSGNETIKGKPSVLKDDCRRKTTPDSHETKETSSGEHVTEKQPMLSETILTKKCMEKIVELGQERVSKEASSDDFEVCFARFSQKETLPESSFKVQENVNEADIETNEPKRNISDDVGKKTCRKETDSVEVAIPSKSDLPKRTKAVEKKQQNEKHDMKCDINTSVSETKNNRAEKRHSNVNKSANTSSKKSEIVEKDSVEISNKIDRISNSETVDKEYSKPKSDKKLTKIKKKHRFWHYVMDTTTDEKEEEPSNLENEDIDKDKNSKHENEGTENKNKCIKLENEGTENKNKCSKLENEGTENNDKNSKLKNEGTENKDKCSKLENEGIENKDKNSKCKNEGTENEEEDSKLDSDIFEVPSECYDPNIVFTKTLAERIKERSHGRRSSVKSYNLNELFSPVHCKPNHASPKAIRSPVGKKLSLPEKKLHRKKSGGCIASAKVINKYRHHRQAHSMSRAEIIPNGYQGDDECERTPGTHKSKINSKLNHTKKKHKFWHYVVETTEEEDKEDLRDLPKELRMLLDGSDVNISEDDTKKTRARKSNIQDGNLNIASESDSKNTNVCVDSKDRNEKTTKESEDKVTNNVNYSEDNTKVSHGRKRERKKYWYYEPMEENNESGSQEMAKDLPDIRLSRLSSAKLVDKSEHGKRKTRSRIGENSIIESGSKENEDIVDNETCSDTVHENEKPTEVDESNQTATVVKQKRSHKKRQFWHYVTETVEEEYDTSDVDLSLPRELRELKGMPLWWVKSEGGSRKRSRASVIDNEKQGIDKEEEVSESRLNGKKNGENIKNVKSDEPTGEVENDKDNVSDSVHEHVERTETHNNSDVPMKSKARKRKVFWQYVPYDTETDSDINNEVIQDLPRLRKSVNAGIESKRLSPDVREALKSPKYSQDNENTFSDSNRTLKKKSKHKQENLVTNVHIDIENDVETKESTSEKEKVVERNLVRSEQKEQENSIQGYNIITAAKKKTKKKKFWHYVVVEEEPVSMNENDSDLPKELQKLRTHLSSINFDSKSNYCSDSQTEEDVHTSHGNDVRERIKSGDQRSRYAIRERVNTNYAEVDSDCSDDFYEEMNENKSTKLCAKHKENDRKSRKFLSENVEAGKEEFEENSVNRQKSTEKELNKISKKKRLSKCLNDDLESSFDSHVESAAENKMNRKMTSNTIKGSPHKSKNIRNGNDKSKSSAENRRRSLVSSADCSNGHSSERFNQVEEKADDTRRKLTNVEHIEEENDCIIVDFPSDEGSRSPIFKNVHSSQSTFHVRKGSPVFKKSPKPYSFKTKSSDRIKANLNDKIDFKNKKEFCDDSEDEFSDTVNRITEEAKLKEIEKAGSGFSLTSRAQRRKEWKRKLETQKNDLEILQSPKRRRIGSLNVDFANSNVESNGSKHDKKLKSPRRRLVVTETLNSDGNMNTNNESRTSYFSDDEVVCWDKKSTEINTNGNDMNVSWSMLNEKLIDENLNSDNRISTRHRGDKETNKNKGKNVGDSQCMESDNEDSDIAEENLRQYVPTFFSSPSKLSNSSWIETVDEYLDNSVKTVTDSSFRGNDSSFNFNFIGSPARDNSKHFGSSPRSKSPFKSAFKLKSPYKNHGCTPTKTKTGSSTPVGSPCVKKVDDDIEFNFGSPQKNFTKFSDLKSTGSVVRDLSSPVAFNITSTPVHRKTKSGKHSSHQD